MAAAHVNMPRMKPTRWLMTCRASRPDCTMAVRSSVRCRAVNSAATFWPNISCSGSSANRMRARIEAGRVASSSLT